MIAVSTPHRHTTRHTHNIFFFIFVVVVVARLFHSEKGLGSVSCRPIPHVDWFGKRKGIWYAYGNVIDFPSVLHNLTLNDMHLWMIFLDDLGAVTGKICINCNHLRDFRERHRSRWMSPVWRVVGRVTLMVMDRNGLFGWRRRCATAVHEFEIGSIRYQVWLELGHNVGPTQSIITDPVASIIHCTAKSINA